jgi:hypothetical protein
MWSRSQVPAGTDIKCFYKAGYRGVYVFYDWEHWHFFLNFKSCFYLQFPSRGSLGNLFPFQNGEVLAD